MMQDHTTDTAAVAELTARGLDVLEIAGAAPLLRMPTDFKVESLEQHLPAPMRKSGTTTLRTADSFIEFINTHKDAATRLYLNDDPAAPSFRAVFNDHTKDAAGWRDFRASYCAPLSREWSIWTSANGKQCNQAQFAKFIEDNLPDVVHPTGAHMLEISRTLEAKKNVDFKSATRLSDGAQEFTYNEDIQGSAGKGTLKIPETFDIGIPVFNGGQAYRITARLRYRIDGGKLALWFELLREHKVLEDALSQLRDQIEVGVGIKAFVGTF